MTARRVVCPGCGTQLQIPATMGEGRIKCPKCSQVLAIRAPAAPAPQAPVAPTPIAPAAPSIPAAAPIPSQDPFANLPPAGAPAPGAGGFPDFDAPTGLPPASAPHPFPASPLPPGAPRPGAPRPGAPRPGAPFPGGPRTAAPKPAKKKKAKGQGGGAVAKVFGILGGAILVLFLLVGVLVGLKSFGILGPRHSGWDTATHQGVTVKLPKGNDRHLKSQPVFGVGTVQELIGRRKESGSQYSIVVFNLPASAPVATVEEVVESATIELGDRRVVTRDGVRGIGGTIVRGGVTAVEGAEAEIFLHSRKLVVTAYAPYSKIKDRVGGTMTPRMNERALDKPEEFFESLKFR